jgi:hypothetical protein
MISGLMYMHSISLYLLSQTIAYSTTDVVSQIAVVIVYVILLGGTVNFQVRHIQ